MRNVEYKKSSIRILLDPKGKIMTEPMEDLISQISNSLQKKELALFCGAGISRNSGLPLANDLKLYLLKQLPIDEKGIDEIMDSNLPLEAFMETLSESSDISKLLHIFKNGEPNTNHILIARLAKKGYLQTILTTNFDLLIEKALENEGFKKGKHFQVYYDENQFSEIDFDNLDKISIFKIHGSADNMDSIRTTLKAIATKSLSEKRMNVINYLFSRGRHNEVLVLGYSCSDAFDITTQIQSIEKHRKEVIFVSHSEKVEDMENIKVEVDKNPFKQFPGNRIKCDTDRFIKKLWSSLPEIIAEEYELYKSKVEWWKCVDDWAEGLEKDKGYMKYFIPGSIFEGISNSTGAIEYYEKCLEIDKEIGDKRGESSCYTNLGIAYYDLGNFRRAIEYYEKSLQIDKEIGEKIGEAACYSNLGLAYYALGNYKAAIEHCEKALEIAKEAGNKAGESRCYTNLGLAYCKLGDFKRAIGYHGESLEIDKEIGAKRGESKCYANLGIAYYGLENFKRAIEYHEKSLQIAKGVGDKAQETRCYGNLGLAYYGMGDFKTGLRYQKKSLVVAGKIGDKAEEGRSYTNLGRAYCELGDFKGAIEYQKKSLQIAKEIGDEEVKAACYASLGLAYCKLGDFDRAIDSYLSGEKIFVEIGQIYNLRDLYKNLSQAYEKMGDYASAEKYKKKSDEID